METETRDPYCTVIGAGGGAAGGFQARNRNQFSEVKQCRRFAHVSQRCCDGAAAGNERALRCKGVASNADCRSAADRVESCVFRKWRSHRSRRSLDRSNRPA